MEQNDESHSSGRYTPETDSRAGKRDARQGARSGSNGGEITAALRMVRMPLTVMTRWNARI